MIDPTVPYQHPGQAAHLRSLGQSAAALVMQRRHVRIHVAGLAEPFRIRIDHDNGLYRAEVWNPRGCAARVLPRSDTSEVALIGALLGAIIRETGTYRVHVECDGDADVPSAVGLAESVLAASRSGALSVEALHSLGDAGVAVADALVRFAAASRVIDPAAAEVAPPSAVPTPEDSTPADTAPESPTRGPEGADDPEADPTAESARAGHSRGPKGRKPRP